jgi:hypothetical protein
MLRRARPGELAALALLILTGLLLGSASRTVAAAPRLIPDDSVARDLAAVADGAWDRFLGVFRARAGCFGDVRLAAATDLSSRAVYDPGAATVTVRVPAPAVMLQGALLHEWAHHVEFQCRAHTELRPAFLAAQGLPASAPWRTGAGPAHTPESVWAGIPSEQYAEAVVELVLGRRQMPTTARVSPEAVRVIAAWAAGPAGACGFEHNPNCQNEQESIWTR